MTLAATAVDRSTRPNPRPNPVSAAVQAFRPVTEEYNDVSLELLEGSLPEGLRGLLYRNGPGKLEVGGIQQQHPFDGDGMVSRFELSDRGVSYRNRYVRTREFVAEQEADAMLYRAFGTNLPGGLARNLFRMRFKNAANTNVIWHGGRLLALWEGGMPHALDSRSLATLGRFDYGGLLHNSSFPHRIMTPELPFSAHPSVCPRTGDLYNFGFLAGRTPTLMVYRGPANGDGLEVRRVPLPRSAFVHDFALTERFLLFFPSPVIMDIARIFSGLSTPVESLRREPNQPTDILLVPRDGGPVRHLQAPSGFFLFHYFGAYEEEDRIIVHGCRMADFRGGAIDLTKEEDVRTADFDPAFPTRWTIDLRTGEVDEEIFDGLAMELPTIDGRRRTQAHRYGWATCREPGGIPIHNGLCRVDFETRDTQHVDYGADLPSEPIFVPRTIDAAEGDGWLLSLFYRAETERTELWVLEAKTLQTAARFGLPHHQPPGFHGCFVDARSG